MNPVFNYIWFDVIYFEWKQDLTHIAKSSIDSLNNLIPIAETNKYH